MRHVREASRAIGGGVLVLVGIGAIALLVNGLYPADLPESRSPDFVDNVFDNGGVLWAARLLLVSAAGVLAIGGIFIVLSIGIRMKNGEWLRRAGPFEIAEST
jgi:multisubunit Na+/H+ antiporter MnhB subunit